MFVGVDDHVRVILWFWLYRWGVALRRAITHYIVLRRVMSVIVSYGSGSRDLLEFLGISLDGLAIDEKLIALGSLHPYAIEITLLAKSLN